MLPWQGSVVLGLLFFGIFRWVLPYYFEKNVFLYSLSSLVYSFSWFPVLFFGVAALFSYLRSSKDEDPQDDSSSLHDAFEETTAPAPIGKPGELDIVQEQPLDQEPASPVEKWTLAALRSLEWKRLETLCAGYYEAVGLGSETIRCSPDGGADLKLFRRDTGQPLAIVQCKVQSAAVGIKHIRELLETMALEKVRRGIFITTGIFTKYASDFGKENPIQLLDGAGFLKKIQELSIDKQDLLLNIAFEGDYKTPSCAFCGTKMVAREDGNGAFWECPDHLECNIIQIKMDELVSV